MRTERFKMEQPGLVKIGDRVEITERGTTILSYLIEPAVAMSGCYSTLNRIKATEGVVKNIEQNERGFYVDVEFTE